MPDSASYSLVIPVKDEDGGKLEQFAQEIRTRFGNQVDLHIVDDGSRHPPSVATLVHPENLGYGAALKTGIRASTATWICTLDGDGQHRLRDVERLIEFTRDFPEVDMVIGDRRLREPSWVRYLGRKWLNWLCSLFAWRYISDLNSGLRVFRRDVAVGYEPILCDRFSFTTSLTLSFLADGYRVDWLPIRVLPRNHGKSRVRVVRDGLVTLWFIIFIGTGLRTRRFRSFLRSVKRVVFRVFFPCHEL